MNPRLRIEGQRPLLSWLYRPVSTAAACCLLAACAAGVGGLLARVSVGDPELAGRVEPAPIAAAAPALPSEAPDPTSRGATIQVVVASNDTLERIFRRMDWPLADLAAMRALPELRQRLDRLRSGETLQVRASGDGILGLQRQLSATETLQVQRGETGFSAQVLSNPLEKERVTVAAVVSSSLFRAAEQAGVSDATALSLAKIFEWDIDFVLDIQPADRFTVVLDRLSQDGEYVKDGEILAAEFVNQGKVYRAVRFENADGRVGYFTPEGRSLRKAFIRAPLEFTRVSSRFNPSRRHPVLNRIRAHKGVDYAAPTGTPVRAAGSGRVRFVGRKGGYGNVIELEHMNRVSTLYGHLSRFARGLARGSKVEQGQVIGYVGRTGLASGPHLHYEYRVAGVHKDPQKVALPTSSPVPATQIAQFRALTSPLVASLDGAAPPANPAALAAR